MRLWVRLTYLLPWKRSEEDRELDAELKSIVDLAADDLGSPDAAHRALGNLTLAKEDARAISKWAWLESVLADIQYAFRVLRREPSFTVIAVVTLGLCIGANAAIFSLIDAVLLRMLPVREPEQLVQLKTSTASYFAWQQFSARSGEWMTGILATTLYNRDVDVGGGPFRGSVELVTGNYFDLLGVPAARGRVIMPEDDRLENPAPVAVLSHRFWRRHFAPDVSALGLIVRVQGVPLTIVGIAPAEFFGVEVGQAADLWIPLSLQPSVFPNWNLLNSPNNNFLSFIGRIRPGVNARVAAEALTPVMIDINATSSNGFFIGRNSSYEVHVDGFQPVEDSDRYAWFDRVGPRYFATIGATLVAGRDVTEADFAGGRRVAVVSESFARHFFQGRDPVERSVYVGEKKEAWEVVGVVRDMRVHDVREAPRRWIYLTAYQPGDRVWGLQFLVRTTGAPASLSNSLRRAIQQVDPRLPVRSINTVNELFNHTLDGDRLLAFLAGSFGVLALAIAAVGIYGLLSYEVAKRTNEVGVRMALGATRSGILALVLWEVLLVCAVGVTLGGAAALACSSLVEKVVFGIEPRDPLLLAVAAAILVLVAFVAAWFPARRAASVDPMLALRHE